MRSSLDGVRVGLAYCGMRRQDIAVAFPDWEDALLSGFAFSLPRKLLKTGAHNVAIHAFGKKSSEFKTEFAVNVSAGDEQQGPWSLRETLAASERFMHEHLIKKFKVRPKFSSLVRDDSGDFNQLTKTISFGQWAKLSGLGDDRHLRLPGTPAS